MNNSWRCKNMMSPPRKRISILDYPEHLNPFAETNITTETIRRGIHKVKLRNHHHSTGTWSSKLSKRVSRSITWIEKSWSEVAEVKKTRERRIKSNNDQRHDTLKNNTVLMRTLAPSFPKSTSEQESTNTSEHARIREQIVHQNGISSTNSVQTTPEIKKRKKRPAPRPPTAKISYECSLSNEGMSSETPSIHKKDEESENLENTGSIPAIDVSTDVKEEKKVSTALTSAIGNTDPQCRGEFDRVVATVDVRTIESEVSTTDEEATPVENSLEELALHDNSNINTDNEKNSTSIKVINIHRTRNEEKYKSNNNNDSREDVHLELHSKVDENDNMSYSHSKPSSNNLVQL